MLVPLFAVLFCSAAARSTSPDVPKKAGALSTIASTHKDVSDHFTAWCEEAQAYLQNEVNVYSTNHDQAAQKIFTASQEEAGITSEFGAVERASLPQSTDGSAAIDAAQNAMAIKFSPEYKELEGRRIQNHIHKAAAEAEYNDGEVLSRNIQEILSVSVRACRIEKDLEAEIQRVLEAAALPSPFAATSLSLSQSLAKMRKDFPLEETLSGLKLRKINILKRQAECAHLQAGSSIIGTAKAAAEEGVQAATDKQVVRAITHHTKLETFSALGSGVEDLKTKSNAVFEEERSEYAATVSELPADSDIVKEVDVAHGYWVEWRDSLESAYSNVLSYVQQRYAQEEASLATHNYLRADNSPHLQFEKIAPPDNIFCDTPEELQARMSEVDDATAQITHLHASLPPTEGLLRTNWDSKCLDYNYNDHNVYMHDCHGERNQQWYINGAGELKTHYDNGCLDYNYNDQNVYMHDCHSGTNQQWYVDSSGQLKTRYDANCLDYNHGDGNVYMHGCHGDRNQQWYFGTAIIQSD